MDLVGDDWHDGNLRGGMDGERNRRRSGRTKRKAYRLIRAEGTENNCSSARDKMFSNGLV